MKTFSNRIGGAAAAFAVFAVGFGGASSAFAQQTVIRNGTVTVHNANGTTTRVTNGLISTTRRRTRSKPRRVVYSVHTTRSAPRGYLTIGSADAQYTLAESRQRLTLAGEIGTVTISGSANNITLSARCRRLVVTGNNNFVLAYRVGEIAAPGSNNQIVWRASSVGKSPRITESGTNNAITHKR